MHAESHVVSVRGISSTTIFIYKYLKNKNRWLPYKWLLFKYYSFYSLEDKDAKHVFEILRNKSKREIKLIHKNESCWFEWHLKIYFLGISSNKVLFNLGLLSPTFTFDGGLNTDSMILQPYLEIQFHTSWFEGNFEILKFYNTLYRKSVFFITT